MRIPREDTAPWAGVENILSKEDITFLIGPAIPLTDKEGNMVRNFMIGFSKLL